jgi:hypothetical protein
MAASLRIVLASAVNTFADIAWLRALLQLLVVCYAEVSVQNGKKLPGVSTVGTLQAL